MKVKSFFYIYIYVIEGEKEKVVIDKKVKLSIFL